MNLKLLIKEHSHILGLFICFLISPILVAPVCVYLFFNEKDTKYTKIYALFICCSLAYLALHTLPNETDDLYRHYENMQHLRYIPIQDVLSSSYQGVYLNTIIMYLCSLTGIYGLYPAIYIGVGYYLIVKNMIRLEMHKRSMIEFSLFVLFVFFCVNCRDFISGLRNYFSFIVCGYLFISYKCFSLDKWKFYIGVFLMGLIHTSVFILFAIFIVFDIVKSEKLKRVIHIGTFLFIPAGIVGLNTIMFLIPSLKESVFLNKILNYITTPNIINLKVYLFLLGILLLAIGCHLINKQSLKEEYASINRFFDYYLVFLLAISPIMLLLTRFLYFIIPLMPILFVQTFDILKTKYKKYLYIILGIFSIVGMIVFFASLKAYPWNFDVPYLMFWFI